MLLRFVIVKNCYLYFFIVLFFWLIHFSYSQGSYIYIYIVYIKFLLSLVTLICSYD